MHLLVICTGFQFRFVSNLQHASLDQEGVTASAEKKRLLSSFCFSKQGTKMKAESMSLERPVSFSWNSLFSENKGRLTIRNAGMLQFNIA